MKIKSKTKKSRVETNIGIGVIVSTQFLRSFKKIYKSDLISQSYLNTLIQWCIAHYEETEAAPGGDIVNILQDKTDADMIDEEDIDLLEDFIEGLNEEYIKNESAYNHKYHLNRTVEFLRLKAYRKLSEKLKESAEVEDLEAINRHMLEFKTVGNTAATPVDPFNDMDKIRTAFENVSDPLITWPGQLGRKINRHFCRGDFVAFMGPEKRGKTWWLLDAALRGKSNRLKVAFFEVGDMSEDSLIIRTHIRQARRSNDIEFCRELLIPTLDCSLNQQGTCPFQARKGCKGLYNEEDELCDVEDAPADYQACTLCKDKTNFKFTGAAWYKKRPKVSPLTWRQGYKIGQKYEKRTRGGFIKYFTYPAKTISATDIHDILKRLAEDEDWVADILVVDYADILAAEKALASSTRDVENEKWVVLRKISLDFGCLVVTATQADAAAHSKTTMDHSNFSETKLKLAHPTAVLGLNQTQEEKKRSIMRINKIVVREGESVVTDTTTVLSCLQIGRPYIDSF